MSAGFAAAGNGGRLTADADKGPGRVTVTLGNESLGWLVDDGEAVLGGR
jgi:hypothetical protein